MVRTLLVAVVALLASLTLSTSMAAAPAYKPTLTLTTTETTITPETARTQETRIDDYGDPYVYYEITAYTLAETGKRPGDRGYGITASGAPAREGVTIACPRSIPYGSTVYFPTLDATYVCQDRGGRITDGHIDLYVKDVRTARRFGRRVMPVKITIKDGD